MVANTGLYYSRENLGSDVSTALSNMVLNSLLKHFSHPLHCLCEHPSSGMFMLLLSHSLPGGTGLLGGGTGHIRGRRGCTHPPPAPMQNLAAITSLEEIASCGPSKRLVGSTHLQQPHCPKVIKLYSESLSENKKSVVSLWFSCLSSKFDIKSTWWLVFSIQCTGGITWSLEAAPCNKK